MVQSELPKSMGTKRTASGNGSSDLNDFWTSLCGNGSKTNSVCPLHREHRCRRSGKGQGLPNSRQSLKTSGPALCESLMTPTKTTSIQSPTSPLSTCRVKSSKNCWRNKRIDTPNGCSCRLAGSNRPHHANQKRPNPLQRTGSFAAVHDSLPN